MEITKNRLKQIIKEELNSFSEISEMSISQESLLRFKTLDWSSLNSKQREEIKALIVLSEMKSEV